MKPGLVWEYRIGFNETCCVIITAAYQLNHEAFMKDDYIASVTIGNRGTLGNYDDFSALLYESDAPTPDDAIKKLQKIKAKMIVQGFIQLKRVSRDNLIGIPVDNKTGKGNKENACVGQYRENVETKEGLQKGGQGGVRDLSQIKTRCRR